MEYNVEVLGTKVWIEWTPSRARALAELMAWRRVARMSGREMAERLLERPANDEPPEGPQVLPGPA